MRPTELDHGLTSSRFARLITHSDWHHLHLLPQLAVRTRSLLLLRTRLQALSPGARKMIHDRHPEVSGFNVGINSGEAAGQTIFHCHVHLIPRRVGDVQNPRGGVRGVVPERQNYQPS